MNTKKLFLYLPLLLALMIGSVGCSKDDESAGSKDDESTEEPVNDEYPETTFFINGEEVPVEIWSTDEMPEWMAKVVVRGDYYTYFYGLYDDAPVFVEPFALTTYKSVPSYEFYSFDRTLVKTVYLGEIENFLKNHTSGWKCIAYNKSRIDRNKAD